MANIEIYTKNWCPYCAAAKSLLEDKGLAYVEFDVTDDRRLESEMQNRSNRTSVPQIFIGDEHVGGFDDLRAASGNGTLKQLIRESRHEFAGSVNARR